MMRTLARQEMPKGAMAPEKRTAGQADETGRVRVSAPDLWTCLMDFDLTESFPPASLTLVSSRPRMEAG